MSTNIEWTDMTINPVTGCEKISAGCQNCFAERMHRRLKGKKHPKYLADFNTPLIWRSELKKPLPKKPKRIFVNSMADLFHNWIPFDFIYEVLELAINNPHHIFQILTKRPENALRFSNWLALGSENKRDFWPSNIWLGVTVEDRSTIHRIETLKGIPAAIKFVSFEPLLEDLGIVDIFGIDWVIVGAETGPSANTMNFGWAQSLCLQALFSRNKQSESIPFFFKKVSKGDFTPVDLMVRQFPKLK